MIKKAAPLLDILSYYKSPLYSWNIYSIPCSVKKFSGSFTSDIRLIKKARPPTHKTFFIKAGSLAYKLLLLNIIHPDIVYFI